MTHPGSGITKKRSVTRYARVRLFFFPFAYDSELSTLREKRKASPAVWQERLFILSG